MDESTSQKERSFAEVNRIQQGSSPEKKINQPINQQKVEEADIHQTKEHFISLDVNFHNSQWPRTKAKNSSQTAHFHWIRFSAEIQSIAELKN